MNGGAFTQIAQVPARTNTGGVTYADTTITALAGNIYTYRVAAINVIGMSAYTNTAQVVIPAVPAAPSNFQAANGANVLIVLRTVNLTWTDNANNETGFTIQRATNAAFTANLTTTNVGANTTSLSQILARNTQYYYRIRANNGATLFSAWVNATPLPIRTNP